MFFNKFILYFSYINIKKCLKESSKDFVNVNQNKYVCSYKKENVFTWSDPDNKMVNNLQHFASDRLTKCSICRTISHYVVLNQTERDLNRTFRTCPVKSNGALLLNFCRTFYLDSMKR